MSKPMPYKIDWALVEALGGQEILTKAVEEFAEALEAHKYTIDVPAPVAHELVELIVRRFDSTYEIVNIPPPPEEAAVADPLV